MFIETLWRFVAKYSGYVMVPLVILGVAMIILRPDPGNPQKYILGFTMSAGLVVMGAVCLARPHSWL
jgi:hypothetical protein